MSDVHPVYKSIILARYSKCSYWSEYGRILQAISDTQGTCLEYNLVGDRESACKEHARQRDGSESIVFIDDKEPACQNHARQRDGSGN